MRLPVLPGSLRVHGARRWRRFRMLLLLAAGAAAIGLAVAADRLQVFRAWELATVDTRFSLRGSDRDPPGLLVVDVDEASLRELDAFYPFDPAWDARVLADLTRGGARAIAYDEVFAKATGPGEARLVRAIERAPNLVLEATEIDRQGRNNVFGTGGLDPYGADVGDGNVLVDPGGEVRRMAYAIDGLKTLPVVLAEKVLGRTIRPSDLGGRSAWIDFRGPPGTIRTVGFADVLRGRVDPGLFRGRIVVVGPSAPALQDVHATSTTGGRMMSGAEVEANEIWTALHGFPLAGNSTWATIALIALLGLVPPLAALRLSLRWTLPASALAALAYLGAAQLTFDGDRILPVVSPVFALVLALLGAVAAHRATAAIERVRELFSRFVPEQVAEELLDRAGAALRLGGDDVRGTIMFTDLRGFTTFSEGLPADEVIDVVNRCLGEQTETILAHGGTLISYLGDGIMAAFGAPVEQPDHADRALAAARELVGERLPELNAWLRERGLGDGFRMGIGLNSGDFVSGNVGSTRRLEYTAIGDVCNAASRIEGLSKGTRHMLLLSDTTCEALREPPADLVYVGEFEVRGRHGTVRLWSLEGVSDPQEAEASAPVAAV